MFSFEVPEFESTFRWLKNLRLSGANLQTIAAAIGGDSCDSGTTIQHLVPTTLDDRLVLHHDAPGKPSDRHVLMLHGLAGCHGSTYMARNARRLSEAGYHAWRLDARGSGAGVALARYHHHAGRSEDLQAAIDFIATNHPAMRLTVVGFSLGANIVLHWAGQTAKPNCSVDSLVAVAPPIDLAACSAGLQRGVSRAYDVYFARVVMQRLKERRMARPDMIDFRLPNRPDSLAQFDRTFTAPAGGFASLQDYYEQASSAPGLASITLPTLVLADRLDPVIPIRIFQETTIPSNVRLVVTQGAGHLGYWAKRPAGADLDRHWMDWRILQVVQAAEQFKSGE